MRFPVSMGQYYVRSNRAQQSVKHPKNETAPHSRMEQLALSVLRE